MRNKDFTNYILVGGAVWFSLLAGCLVIILCCDLDQSVRDWRSWVLGNEMSQWLHIPLSILLIFFLIALVAAIWRRIIGRCRLLGEASRDQHSSIASRKKYAFWSSARRSTGRHAVFGALRSRKKIGR